MGSAGTKVAPEITRKLGVLNLSIIASDCEDESPTPHEVWARPECPPSPKYDLLSTARETYLTSHSSSSSAYSSRLPRVLEESESFSHRETTALDASNTSSNASSASSSQAFLCRGQSEGPYNGHGYGKRVKQKKRRSLISMLLWPLKKVRDGYVSCMMSMEGAGDLSGIAQGATFATSSKYFDDLPLSKTDARNHG